LSQDPVSWEIGLTNDGKRTLLDPQLQNSYSYARNNPVLYKDPEGRIIPLLAVAYVAAEAALSAYDAYNTYQTVTSQSTSRWEKVATAGGFVLGTVAPGAGYGTAGKAVANNVTDVAQSKALTNVAKSTVHGNSLQSPKLNYGYQLVDKFDSNKILKFGITGNNVPFRRYSGPQYEFMNARMRILNEGSRIDMRAWETAQIKSYEIMYGSKPPLNKNYR
jgi:hypothetical protein